MTKYTQQKFSVSMGAANISDDAWERTFGKKYQEPASMPAIDAQPPKFVGPARRETAELASIVMDRLLALGVDERCMFAKCILMGTKYEGMIP